MLMMIGMVSTQLGAATAKRILGATGSCGSTLLRLGFASAILLVVIRPSLRMTWRTAGWIAAFGVAMAGMNLSFYTALTRVPLAVAVTIGFAGPLAVSLAAGRRRLDIACALLAGGGVLLLAGVDDFASDVDPLGLALCGLLAVCWGGYVVFGSRVSQHAPRGQGLALGMAFAALCVAVGFVAVGFVAVGFVGSGRGAGAPGTALLDPRLLVLGFAVAVLSSVIPYSAEMAALGRLPAGVFAVLLSLEPAIAAAVGAVLLGEVLTGAQFCGVLCVVSASIGTTWLATRTGRPRGTTPQ